MILSSCRRLVDFVFLIYYFTGVLRSRFSSSVYGTDEQRKIDTNR